MLTALALLLAAPAYAAAPQFPAETADACVLMERDIARADRIANELLAEHGLPPMPADAYPEPSATLDAQVILIDLLDRVAHDPRAATAQDWYATGYGRGCED